MYAATVIGREGELHMKSGWKLWALMLFFSVSAFAQDYLCTTSKKRYYQPGACQQECRPTREGNGLTRSVTMADKPCSFQSICAGIMKHLSGGGDMLVLAYGAVALQKRTMIPQPEKIIISQVLGRFYGYSIKQFNVVIGDPSGRDQWASLTPSRVGLPTLTVSHDLYLLTPAFLISVIGHEMVHDQQYKRKNPVDPTGFTSLVDSIRELEASHWQMGIDTFNRGFRLETDLCLADDERKEIRQVHACREWQVRRAIENISHGPRAQLFSNVEKWLMADPWAKQVYIPEHPDWKTARAGAPPDEECAGK